MNQSALKIIIPLLFSTIFIVSNSQNAKEIFKKNSPGVVLIKTPFSHGSGVVLTKKGIILTNYHVVNTPYPLEVLAEVEKEGRKIQIAFKKVQIQQVHKKYDLALIRIQLPKGVSLKPLPMAKQLPTTGENCFVIGNPGGVSGQILENSISTGVISATKRIVKKKAYIQTTAPINPGNSGGALIDSTGTVIGIITFIISNTEGIGFAIPASEIRKEDFVKKEIRPVNALKAKEHFEIGKVWYIRSTYLSGDAKKEALEISLIAFSQALIEQPNLPLIHFFLGNIFFDQKEFSQAKLYFQKAIELNRGKSPIYLKMLGLCEENSGNHEKAIEIWREAVLCKNEHNARSQCAENLAIDKLKAYKFPEAAYLIRWANVIGPPEPNRKKTRGYIEQEALKNLTPPQKKFLQSKNQNFSFGDMIAFKEGLFQVEQNLYTESENATLSQKDPPLFIEKAFEEALKNSVEPGPKGLIVNLPENPVDCRPSYGGLYWILRFSKKRQLGIFNIATAKFEAYIPLPSEISLFASGGKTLIIYDPIPKRFLIYDLETFQQTHSERTSIQGVIKNINMGLFISDKAFISWTTNAKALEPRNFGVLEIPSLRKTNLYFSKTKGFLGGSCNRDRLHFRFDPFMKRYLAWCTSHSPRGFSTGTFSKNTLTEFYRHVSHGSLFFTADPELLLGWRTLLTTDGLRKQIYFGDPTKVHSNIYFPVLGSKMILVIDRHKVDLIGLKKMKSFQSFTLPSNLEFEVNANKDFTGDRCVFASAYLKKAVFLNPEDKQIWIFKIPSKPVFKEPPPPLNSGKAGKMWVKNLNYPPGTKIQVEDSPAGIELELTPLSLRWQIPPKAKPGLHKILISIIEPGKEKTFEVISMHIIK